MSRGESTSFGQLLKQRRLLRGLTQEMLAESSGLGIRSIQGLERGENQPRRETLRRLAQALELSVEQISELERAGHPQPRQRHASAHHNLPVQLTTFIGRERELVDLTELLRATHLLTLTGTGGCGKTRLALELAATSADEYADGVRLAELAGLADPDLVAQSVASATGVRESAGESIRATLLAALHSRSQLVVLDNCEHLVLACADLADSILRVCPGVRILATSREALGIAGELTWRVPSLTVAPVEAALSPDELSAYEAPRLFVDRAAAVDPSFQLNVRTARAITQICQRLDGIPHAIELAARRVTALSVEQIAERLDERFRLLTSGSRAALPRQQTLAATVEWSYNLLDLAERALFDRLSVFAGGFDLDAAEQICSDPHGASPDVVLRSDVLDLLCHLVDKSLVVAEAGSVGVEGYRLLETLRQYTRERLADKGELQEIRRRHAEYYQALAVEAAGHLLGADQVPWLDRLDREHENLRAALRFAIESQNAELGMNIAASLHYFWYFRAHYTEARTLRSAVLALPGTPELGALRAEVLYGSGMLALHQGDYTGARAFVEEGVAFAREAGARRQLAPTLATLGFVTRVQGDYATARRALEEVLTLGVGEGLDDYHTAMALHHLGLVYFEADADIVTAWSLNERALTIGRRIGDRRFTGNVLSNMARIARARGNVDLARAALAEALLLHRAVGDVGQQAVQMYVLAAIDADAGLLDSSVRLAGAADRQEERLGVRVWPVIRRERDAWLEPARRALGDEQFARAWEDGWAMTREQALEFALDDTKASLTEPAWSPGL
jgi:predicted ATPase/DNA-binding XRE family transcriptional regulator